MVVLTVDVLLDGAAWQRVVEYLPTECRDAVIKLVQEALEAVTMDKHFAAERFFDDAFDLLDRTAEQLRSQTVTVKVPQASKNDDGSTAPCGASPSPALPTSMGVRLAKDFLLASRGWQIVASKCADSRAIIAECDPGNASWKPVSVDSATGYGTYYRGEPGSSIHSFKVVGMVHAEVVALACVLLELDLYKEWFPFCYYSEVVKEEARFHKSSRFAVRSPWPLANREVAITGFGLDDLENLRVVVKACTDPALGDAPHRKGNVMADLNLGGFYIEPCAQRDTRITFFMNIDPKIPHLPTALLNWVCGNLMWVVLRQLGKAAERAMDPNGVYGRRRAARPDVYEYFVRRGAEVLSRLPAQAPPPARR